jgi:hypothetical protein
MTNEERLELARAVVGSVVQYTNLGDRDGRYPPEIQAALVTGLNDDLTVSLHVFYRTGGFDMPSVAYTAAEAGTEPARGKWTNVGAFNSPSVLVDALAERELG